jgi:hypothetical protein
MGPALEGLLVECKGDREVLRKAKTYMAEGRWGGVTDVPQAQHPDQAAACGVSDSRSPSYWIMDVAV